MASEEELNRIKEFRDLMGEINKELGKKTNHVKEAVKSYNNLDSIAKQLQINEEITNTLSDKQLNKLKSKAALQIQELERSAKLLAKEKGIEDINGVILGFKKNLNEEEKALLNAYKQGFQLEQESLDIINEEVATREKVNKSLGFAGNSMKFLNSIAGGLGKALNMDKISEDMEDFANESIRAGKEVGRLQTLGVGLKSAFVGLGQTLTDPTIVFGTLLKSFLEFNKLNRESRQLTGQTADNFNTFNDSLVSSQDQVKTITSLSKELGINVNAAFSSDTILAATELTDLMGLSAEESANLAMGAEAFGQDLSNISKSAEDTVKSFAKQGKGALNLKDVMSEAGKASTSLSVSLKGNPDSLVKAAAGAKALGLSLSQAESIADSLLNFESSISSEIEAELLTGKQLNLEKARTAALNNDIATMTEEIGNNQDIIQSFSSGNRIQQEAIAKSLGMSKNDVAKMVLLQQKANGLTDEQAAKAAGISVDEAKRLSVQEQMQKSIEKITSAFAPILEHVASLLSNGIVLKGVMGAIGTILLVKIAGSLASSVKGFKDMASSTMSMFQNLKGSGGLMGKIKDKLLGGGGDKSKTAIPGGDSVGKAVESTKGASAKQGEGIKGLLKGLGDGLASIGKQFVDVVKGSLALGIAGLALAGSFALGLQMVKDVDPVQMIAFAGAMSMMGLTLALLGKIGGQVIQGALAMGILGVALIPAAFAFSLLEGVSIDKMIAFSIALPLLALAAAGLGFIAPFIMAGAAALAVLGASLIPAAIAFNMLGDSPIEEVLGKLEGVASIAPQLLLVSGALFGIAGGLGAIAGAGFLALPVLGALTALGAISGGLGSLFGDDEEGGTAETKSEDDPMIKKLDELNNNIVKLISIVEKGGNVTMDGAAVGKVLALGSSKLG